MKNTVLVLKSNAVVDTNGLKETLDKTLNKIMKYDFTMPIDNDEDNIAIKKILADSRKDWKSINDEKIAFKKAVLEPFDKVDKVLKEYKEEFDKRLNLGADNSEKYETSKKKEKEDSIRSYFEELKTLHGLDFLTFDKLGLNITLSVSEKKLREETLDFVNRVLSDLKLIDTQTHAERIKVRYTSIMDVKQAITSVLDEIKQEESLQGEKLAETPEVVEPKVEKTLSAPVIKEETIKVQFTVTATRTQIIKLKEIMETEGIEYE